MDADVKKTSQTYLDDAEVKRLIALSQSGDNVARDTLVNCNIRLVWSVVQRFMNRGMSRMICFRSAVSVSSNPWTSSISVMT